MKRTFTLFLLCVFAVTFAMAQAPEGVFTKASVAPEIDGVVDAEWEKATKYSIDRVVVGETPTVGAPGETYWQGLWMNSGIYILVNIADNEFYPNYIAGTGLNDYDYDKLEIYFDVNYTLVGEIPQGAQHNKGHYQVTAGYAADLLDGTPTTGTDGVIRAFMLDGSNILAEYFVPFSKLLDSEGAQFDKTNTIGFDVTVIDRDASDAARNQAVWSNEGTVGASWGNLDDAGRVTLEGAEAIVDIESIEISGDTEITTDNGTIQLTATILPEEATQTYKWVIVEGAENVTITKEGLIKAIKNDGTVTVKATSSDEFVNSNEITITITGQQIDRNDIWNNFNLIQNWNTDENLTSWSGWVDNGVPGQTAPVVEDGIVVMVPAVATDGAAWHYQHNQSGFKATPNVPYVLAFKSWASGDAPAVVDFEDIAGNGNNRYGMSTDENSNGRSEWNYTLTTEPQWYVFNVTFDQIVANTVEKVQWMLSLTTETIYLDSVLLITKEEYDLLATLPAGNTGVNQLAKSINKVYPNPVGNGSSLFVELSKANTKVAIYNAVGQKMMEKVSTGNVAQFDVSSLRQGMYFVKTSDGSIQKFIR